MKTVIDYYDINQNNNFLNYPFQTKQEIADQEENIRAMEVAVHAKTNPLKLAETRLENRTNRPHVELCRDDPQEGLTMEVQALRDTIHQLTIKLDHSRSASFK